MLIHHSHVCLAWFVNWGAHSRHRRQTSNLTGSAADTQWEKLVTVVAAERKVAH